MRLWISLTSPLGSVVRMATAGTISPVASSVQPPSSPARAKTSPEAGPISIGCRRRPRSVRHS